MGLALAWHAAGLIKNAEISIIDAEKRESKEAEG